MIYAYSLIDLVNKYEGKREIFIEDNSSIQTNLFGNTIGKQKYKKISGYKLFCKKGDLLEVITPNAGAWKVVIAVKNKDGQLFSIKWKDIVIAEMIENTNFTLE